MEINVRRSVLYVPGANERALAGAFERGADCLILDLEDAVAPAVKAAARANLLAVMAKAIPSNCESIIRINGFGSDLAGADLEMAAEARSDGILVPKINTVQDVERAARAMEKAGVEHKTRLWLMIETPLAMINIREIAACVENEHYQLEALVIGTNDFYAEMRARSTPERGAVIGLLSLCVAAARAYGLDIIDGVFNNFSDARGFAAECEQGRDLGMDGKSLIHPAQIEICNRIFSPSPEDIGWAQEVSAAFALPENGGKGVISLNGRMVERLHLENANRILMLVQRAR